MHLLRFHYFYNFTYYPFYKRIMLPNASALPEVATAPAHAELADLRRQVAALQLLANLPEYNPNPILRYDAAGLQLYANPAALALRHGLSRTEQVLVRQRLRAAAKAGVAGQPVAQLQVGARYFQLSVVTTLPPAGSVTLYLAETTGRVLAEQQLTEQQAFINNILATMPNLVHVRNTEGTLVFENRAATELRAQSGHVGRHCQGQACLILDVSSQFRPPALSIECTDLHLLSHPTPPTAMTRLLLRLIHRQHDDVFRRR
ncbi:MAG: hypothetical protein EOO38_09340 [Cytophagaceae bacterium]|nr:MAG: hypothetical protein EOO38_09340 [Cytophagaceae bacterium]